MLLGYISSERTIGLVVRFDSFSYQVVYCQDFLELRGYSYERLDGSIRAEERFSAIRSFSKQSRIGDLSASTGNCCAFVFLISTRAGGVGLNLVAADTVVFYEQDWNPQVDKQALQRAHRIGQESHVLSINLVTAQTVEEVIMRRAERKLQLSHNVIGDEIDQEWKEMVGPEGGDLRSVILGLHMLDLAETVDKNTDQLNVSELTEMVEKIAGFRDKIQSGKNDRKFEINPMNVLNDRGSVEFRGPESIAYDPGLDEASYRSWVEKFKEVSPLNNDTELDMRSRRSLPEEKLLKADAARKKSMEKKVSKWEALGYYSLSVSCPVIPTETDVFSVSGAVHFVYGDCTHPSRDSPSDHAIIFSCVDTSGNWGRGGMFDALTRLSANIPDAYEKAHEFGDLHLGDMHLIPLKEDSDDGASGSHVSQWVALAVVQSYNPRREVPRGDISIAHLEECLAKASYSAVQNSASIHMPRIGYQGGSNRSEWYTVERLLRKYAALYGIQIFVYYYRRSG